MADNTISGLTTEEYANYESQMISLIRESRPELDLRVGTAIRDILVRTSAQSSGVMSKDIDDLRATMSFKLLEENPDLATDAVVESLASNYGVVRREGVSASGYAAIYFLRDEEVIIPSGYRLRRGSYEYETTQLWKIRSAPSASNELPLYTDENGVPFAIIPMSAIDSGSATNVQAGETMELLDNTVLLVNSAESYSDISGGRDQETVEELLQRISEALSHRELTSQAAISVRLKNEYPVVDDVIVTGFGDEEQLRDKHNVFGVAIGSRIDAWVKTFTEPERMTLIKRATKVSDGAYTFTLTPDEVGVIYKIAAVTSPESIITADGSNRPTVGSYPFTEQRNLYNSSGISHDISSDPDLAIIETAYTRWQSTTVTVTDVGAVGGTEPYPAELDLRVDVYVAPQIDTIQAYLDDADNRNKEADILVRGAIPAFVELSIPIYRKSSAVLDLDAMRTAVTDYVNDKNLGDDLTLSQLASVLHQYDILKVGTTDEDLIMTATIRAADGSELTLSGSELRIQDVRDAQKQVTADTTVFVADVGNVYVIEKVV